MNYLFSLVVLLCLTSANSQRLRKEIRDLSPSEFEATLTAFRRLYESGAIANFARRHAQADMPAHGGSQFLPWHRHAIYNFENEFLNAAGGQLSGLPYWDSTLDARNPEGSVLLTPEAFGTARGCVTNGAAAGWMKPGNICLRRNVNGPWLHSSGIAIFSRPGVDFATFATSVEMTVHSYTHNGIGGDMASIPQSAYDPLFYLHHAGVDYWWSNWQTQFDKYTEYNGNHRGRTVSSSDDIMGRIASDIVDFRKLGYRYQPPGANALNNRLPITRSTSTATSTNSSPTPSSSSSASNSPSESNSPSSTAPPSPSPTGTNQQNLTIPEPAPLSEEFLKNFGIDPSLAKEFQSIVNLVVKYLNHLQESGKPLPSLDDLKNIKIGGLDKILSKNRTSAVGAEDTSTGMNSYSHYCLTLLLGFVIVVPLMLL